MADSHLSAVMRIDTCASRAIHHHRDVYILVRLRLDEIDLPTAILFSRSPQELDLARKPGLANDERQSYKPGDAGSCNQIMPTGMSDSGQRIVFGIEIDTTPIVVANHGLKCSAKTVGVAVDGDFVGDEEVTDSVMGMVLLVRQLWGLMDLRLFSEEEISQDILKLTCRFSSRSGPVSPLIYWSIADCVSSLERAAMMILLPLGLDFKMEDRCFILHFRSVQSLLMQVSERLLQMPSAGWDDLCSAQISVIGLGAIHPRIARKYARRN